MTHLWKVGLAIIRAISLWSPVFIQMGLIFYFSAQPMGSPVLEGFPVPAGLGHFAGYLILGFLLYRAFNGGLGSWSLPAGKKTLIVGSLYAVSDELHQLFVPGRECSVVDLVIDIGAIVFVLLCLRVLRRSEGTG